MSRARGQLGVDGGRAEQVSGGTALDGTQRDAGVTPRSSDTGHIEESG